MNYPFKMNKFFRNALLLAIISFFVSNISFAVSDDQHLKSTKRLEDKFYKAVQNPRSFDDLEHIRTEILPRMHKKLPFEDFQKNRELFHKAKTNYISDHFALVEKLFNKSEGVKNLEVIDKIISDLINFEEPDVKFYEVDTLIRKFIVKLNEEIVMILGLKGNSVAVDFHKLNQILILYESTLELKNNLDKESIQYAAMLFSRIAESLRLRIFVDEFFKRKINYEDFFTNTHAVLDDLQNFPNSTEDIRLILDEDKKGFLLLEEKINEIQKQEKRRQLMAQKESALPVTLVKKEDLPNNEVKKAEETRKMEEARKEEAAISIERGKLETVVSKRVEAAKKEDEEVRKRKDLKEVAATKESEKVRHEIEYKLKTGETSKVEEAKKEEAAAKAERERIWVGELKKAEEAGKVAEEAKKQEPAKKAEEVRRAEEAKKAERIRQQEERARKVEEARKAEVAAKAERERIKAEEARIAEVARKAAIEGQIQEKARKAKEARKAEETKKAEEDRKAEEAAKAEKEIRGEVAHKAEETKKAEKISQQEERARKAEEMRKAEAAAKAERERIKAEAIRKEQEASKAAEEARRQERQKKAEETRRAEEAKKQERAKKAEEVRKAEEASKAERIRQQEERARKAEEARKAEAAAKAERERTKVEAAKKAHEARKAAEETRKQEEAKKFEEARIAEETRKAAIEAQKQEMARKAEEARKADDARKTEEAAKVTLEEQKRQEKRLAEEERKAEEAKKAEKERSRVEEERKAEEARKVEEVRRSEEASKIQKERIMTVTEVEKVKELSETQVFDKKNLMEIQNKTAVNERVEKLKAESHIGEPILMNPDLSPQEILNSLIADSQNAHWTISEQRLLSGLLTEDRPYISLSLLRMAKGRLSRNEFDETVKNILRSAIAVNPDQVDAEAYRLLGKLEWDQVTKPGIKKYFSHNDIKKRKREILDIYQKAWQMDSSNGRTGMELSKILLSLNEYVKSANAVEKAMESVSTLEERDELLKVLAGSQIAGGSYLEAIKCVDDLSTVKDQELKDSLRDILRNLNSISEKSNSIGEIKNPNQAYVVSLKDLLNIKSFFGDEVMLLALRQIVPGLTINQSRRVLKFLITEEQSNKKIDLLKLKIVDLKGKSDAEIKIVLSKLLV